MLRKLYAAEIQANLNKMAPAPVEPPAVAHYRDCDGNGCTCATRKNEHTSKLENIMKLSSGRARTGGASLESKQTTSNADAQKYSGGSSREQKEQKHSKDEKSAKEQKQNQSKEEQSTKDQKPAKEHPQSKDKTPKEQPQKEKQPQQKEKQQSKEQSQKEGQQSKEQTTEKQQTQQQQQQSARRGSWADIAKAAEQQSSTATLTDGPQPQETGRRSSWAQIVKVDPLPEPNAEQSNEQQQPHEQSKEPTKSQIRREKERRKSQHEIVAEPKSQQKEGENASKQSKKHEESSSATENSRGQVLAGKHTVTAEEVFQVAAYDYEVKLDTAAIAELEEKLNAPSAASATGKGKAGGVLSHQKLLDISQLPISEAKTWESADHQQTRAVLFVRLIGFLQGRAGVRTEVVQFIAELLNAKVYLHVSNLESLLPFFYPNCSLSCIFNHVNTTFDKTGLKGPSLTEREADAFVSGQVVNSAILALAVHALQVGLNLADAVGALSLEVTQGSLSPFSLVSNDLSRPHRSLITVANNIRLLTESSSRVSSNEKQEDADCIRDIPSIHGSGRDALLIGLTTSRVELNSAEALPVNHNENHGTFHALPVVAVMRVILSSVNDVAHASEARLGVIGKLSGEETGGNASEEKKDNGHSIPDDQLSTSLLPSLTNMLTKLKSEAAKGAEFLTRLNSAANTEVAAKQAAKEEREREIKAQREKEASEKEDKNSNNEKANKKREEKLKKQAEKASEKAKKKGQQISLKLGNGTTNFLAYINNLNVLSPFSNQDLQFFLDNLLTTSNQICKPKIPRGTRDTSPTQMVIRERCFHLIKNVFLAHGAVGIDTPLFERKETLMGKYGEDSKLIYELADQGGEMLALRYDLTVPLARYIAVHQVTNLKRYHIARVYRRDNPAMNRGRYREFYQCDYDVAGNYPTMVPDADVLKVVCDILEALDLQFKVKLNHRAILDSLMQICGVPTKSFRPICSAIDKLDKETWETVKEEMVVQKGLSEESANKLGKYVTLPPASPAEMLATLRADSDFVGLPKAKQALDDLELLFRYLKCFGCLERISFDLSLARGLDYYTGVIYEAVLTDTGRVGSIAAGGRYDNLVGMFSAKPVPAVGVSVGIERLLSILEEREEKKGVRESHTEVLVASIGNGMLVSRLKVARELWKAHIPCELLYDENPKPKKQMDYALEHKIPFVLFIGETELKEGVVKVRDMAIREEVVVKNEELAEKLRALIAAAASRPPTESAESVPKAETQEKAS